MSTEIDWGRTTHHSAGRPAAKRAGRTPRRSRRRLLPAMLALTLALGAVVAIRALIDDGADTPADCHLARCIGSEGIAGAPITRAQVAVRARRWLANDRIPYSMTGNYTGPGGWGLFRRDCSGFVSMALHLDDDGGGPSTVTIVDDLAPIRARDLKPYDLLGRLGPGSGGEYGHIQLFLGWVDAAHTRVRVAEQGGLRTISPFPHTATYAWPEAMADGTPLSAYRYRNIQD